MDNFLLSRLTSSIKRSGFRMNLDLRGLVVVAECATGAYSCTAAIAAFTGATKVIAFGKDTPYGTFEAAREGLYCLWRALGISEDGLLATDSLNVLDENLGKADIVTNSGHLRPLNSERIKEMRRSCVIPLMYESWEFRHTDLCLQTCQKCGIAVVGTNERHPDIEVFEYLGPLTIKALLNEGLEVSRNTILLISDNDLGHYIEKSLSSIGAHVVKSPREANEEIDAIVFAYTPVASYGTLDISSMSLPKDVPVCCQVWGDLDRTYFKTKWVPEKEPEPGHMGLILSSLGVEPIVRLQSGGLKVAEIVARARQSGLSPNDAVRLSVEKGFGQKLKDF